MRIFRLFKWDVTFSAVSRSLSAGVFDLRVTRHLLGAGSKGAPESLIVPLLAIDFIGARASCPWFGCKSQLLVANPTLNLNIPGLLTTDYTDRHRFFVSWSVPICAICGQARIRRAEELDQSPGIRIKSRIMIKTGVSRRLAGLFIRPAISISHNGCRLRATGDVQFCRTMATAGVRSPCLIHIGARASCP